MKRFFAVILSILIVIPYSVSAFAFAENAKLTYLYLDKGNIVIGDGTVSGYGYFGERVTTYDSDGYYITQTKQGEIKNTIEIVGGENYVVINSLDVYVASISKFTCAFSVSGSADVTLKLEGQNIFLSGDSRAGVEVSEGSSLSVIGDGKLMAGSNAQAGIGGGNGLACGKIVINSGTIVGQSNSNGAGIGGGSAGSNTEIIINGGNVLAKGGASGAGIGGGCTGDGGQITINGGTITAVGGANAAGIGGGWYGSMGSVVINGGSVKATGGSGAPAIGSGAGETSGTILNSDGEKLYLAKVDTSSMTSVKEIYTDGNPNNISSYHSNDKCFYFYLPAQTHIFAADSNDSLTSFWKASYGSSFTCSAVTPFECVKSSTVRADDLIRGLSCGLETLDNYVSFADGFSFEYSDSVIGTGTEINLIYNNRTVFCYTALIYGDLNGDGWYDGEDSMIASLMLWGHLTSANTQAFLFEAADVNRNSTVDTDDIYVLQQAGVLLASVPQTEEGTVDTDSTQWDEYIMLIEQVEEEADEEIEEEQPVTSLNIIEFIRFIAEYIKKLLISLLNI